MSHIRAKALLDDVGAGDVEALVAPLPSLEASLRIGPLQHWLRVKTLGLDGAAAALLCRYLLECAALEPLVLFSWSSRVWYVGGVVVAFGVDYPLIGGSAMYLFFFDGLISCRNLCSRVSVLSSDGAAPSIQGERAGALFGDGRMAMRRGPSLFEADKGLVF